MNLRHTPLHAQHIEAGAKMGPFAGWEMPLYYGSQLEEHHKVRRDAGMFDVSHMNVLDIEGQEAEDYLRFLIANDIAKLKTPGKALYGCMLNETGGVVDDLIVYRRGDRYFRMVINAATRDKDMAWLRKQQQKFDVKLFERTEYAMIAIQGPNAIKKCNQVFTSAQKQAAKGLKIFQGAAAGDWWIARTGYTGEDGFEIIIPADEAPDFWNALLKVGVAPCGLVARDSLRLEAGLDLYGSEMDEDVSPLEANLAWTIVWEPEDRDFIGKQALLAQKQQGVKNKLVGLVLEDKGMLRSHQQVVAEGVGEGITTSGGFSPTLGVAIALARVPATIGESCFVIVRGKKLKAKVVKPSFVRHGKSVVVTY